ncbi:cbb3-type cytochrome oxidase assembly protein CcoS [Paracoccus aminophilus]|uniref:Cytochrome oxidase maturation protein n=1 Tax=Paracoccus aminophilus JCM 7686 TaxID=1367847 RepID=S5XLV0_PARAH|nr:cbb3-type cytochrome oxidase assembly protein CcoS [Paracoccus aminophilus]AGT08224.1 cytochrome oxidase maturation protein [Paracoccus aminophilus JCM 7686]
MSVVGFLIPVSLALGGLGLWGFIWSLRRNQYDDPKGDAERVLSSEWDDKPRPR